MAQQAKALGSTLVPLSAQGSACVPWPLQAYPSSPSASDALRRHMSHRLRGRYVPSPPRQPASPVNRDSPGVPASSKTPRTLLQKGLTSRDSSLGGPHLPSPPQFGSAHGGLPSRTRGCPVHVIDRCPADRLHTHNELLP